METKIAEIGMSDIEIIIYTACATLIGGVILLVITELIKVVIVLPVQKTKERMQVALSRVDFHCNLLTNFFSANPDDDERSRIRLIQKELREAATDLNAQYTLVPMKKVLATLGILPDQKRINTAFEGLMYLHNSILYEGRREYITNLIEMNDNRIERIKAALTGKSVPAEVRPNESSR